MEAYFPNDIELATLATWNKYRHLPTDRIISRAILAERQRCADVVDSWSTTDPSLKTNLHFVAAAILNP